MPQKTSPQDSAPKHIPNRLKLSDASSSPGLALMEGIAHNRRPKAEDVAILSAWQWRPHQPIKIVPRIED